MPAKWLQARCPANAMAFLSDGAAVQEKVRALSCARGYLFLIRDQPLAQHHGALRIHCHHAAQHSSSRRWIVERDQSAFALATQPDRNAFIGPPDCQLMEGRPDLRE